MMFCSDECMDQMYKKLLCTELVLSDDGRMISEIQSLLGKLPGEGEVLQDAQVRDFNKTIFDFDFRDPINFNLNRITCFLSLKYKEPNRVNEEYCVVRCILPKPLRDLMWNVVQDRKNRASCVWIGNTFLKTYQDGAAVTLFSSLINEGCVGNAYRLLVDDKIVTFISKPIITGEEILFNR